MSDPACADRAAPHPTLLRAVLDRLIPADEWPGALAAGVDRYVEHQLTHAWADRRHEVAAGLASLGTATDFDQLTAPEKDARLKAHEREPWFDLLVNLAAEGYYADPGNGGNADAASWRMIGYAANRFTFPPPPAALPRRKPVDDVPACAAQPNDGDALPDARPTHSRRSTSHAS